MQSDQNPSEAAVEITAAEEGTLKVSHRPIVNWHKQQVEGYGAGDRAADALRNGMGSWKFVIGFLVVMVVWAMLNVFGTSWDPYPFILLNLFLSMLAGLQGAILLIAAKRQDAVAAALAEHDYATNVAAKRDIEDLIAINKQQLDLIQQLLRAKKAG